MRSAQLKAAFYFLRSLCSFAAKNLVGHKRTQRPQRIHNSWVVLIVFWGMQNPRLSRSHSALRTRHSALESVPAPVFLPGADDFLDERVADDVGFVKMAKGDAGTQGASDKEIAEAKSKEKADKEQSDKQESAKVAKDAAEGKKTGDVIDGLIDSGKNVDEAVALAIKAGIDPATVIYTAIVKEYSNEKVIEGALEAGVKPAVVVKTAMDAGAEKKEIIVAATDAGLSKEAVGKVADTVAKTDTASGDTGVLGFTEPVEPAVTNVVYVATDSYTVSGGGGAEPSTATASPTAP